jgi:signal transduction histidine kinase
MVSDLLDAACIEASRLELDRTRIALPAAMESLLNQLRPTVGNHVLDVRFEGEPPPIFADPYRLDQILTNIVDNAAKYSPEETPIHITVKTSGGGVMISVRDHGIGITPEEIPHLFDRFYQAKRARAQKTGLGLGLYITKGLVEAGGGQIRVESIPGEGTTFYVWLPPFPEGAPTSLHPLL